jgi:hypothetical protein
LNFTGFMCGASGTFSVYGNKCYRGISSAAIYSESFCSYNSETLISPPLTTADNFFIRCETN